MSEINERAFTVLIRDRDHFYKIVRWLSKNVGNGKTHWTMKGRILRRLSSGPVSTTIIIKNDNVDEVAMMYLTLV